MRSRGTRTQGHEEILLGQELDAVAGLRRTRVHKVAALLVETGGLEDVDHVMDIRLVEAVGLHGPGQV